MGLGRFLLASRRAEALLALNRALSARSGRVADFLALVVRYRLARNWSVHVHQSAVVGHVRLGHPSNIVIGAGVIVEDGVTLYQGVTLGAVARGGEGYPIVRRGATIYNGSSVLGSVEIGADSVIGANSVVLIDVPAGATAAGTPARLVRRGASPRGSAAGHCLTAAGDATTTA